MIQNIIEFAKLIPGFMRLSQDDQVTCCGIIELSFLFHFYTSISILIFFLFFFFLGPDPFAEDGILRAGDCAYVSAAGSLAERGTVR